MWTPDTETVFKLHSVLFGFHRKRRNEMYPRCLANQSSVSWGPIIFDLHIFASSDSKNSRKLFQAKVYLTCATTQRKTLFLQFKSVAEASDFFVFYCNWSFTWSSFINLHKMTEALFTDHVINILS